MRVASLFEPRHIEDVMSAAGAERPGLRLSYQLARRSFAPVRAWGLVDLQLPPPPWNGPE